VSANDELCRKGKEVITACWILPQQFHQGSEENHKRPQWEQVISVPRI